MRIHPPTLTLDPNDPFKDALYGRRTFAESLTALLRNTSEGLVVFVHAPWGEGKTTFAKMWMADLARQNLNAIYFDAFQADYFVDPFIAFSGEILHMAAKQLPKGKGITERREFKKRAVQVGKRLAGVVANIGIKAATMGVVDSTHIEALKDIGSDLATDVAKIGSETIEERIENYAGEKDSLKSFKDSLTKLAAAVRQEKDFPLTILVDELDRCRPDFALALLERIKHLFDVEGVAFVLLVNRDQIESHIRSVYGSDDARAYLLKFATVFVQLPNRESRSQLQYQPGRWSYCRTLFDHHGFGRTVRDPQFLTDCLGALSDLLSLTLREIEKVFTVLALYYGAASRGTTTDAFLVALLAILKVKTPGLYAKLKKGQLPLQDLLSETHLQDFRLKSQPMDPNWPKTLLQYCLLPETEYQTALNIEQTSTEPKVRLSEFRDVFAVQRTTIIPYICDHLDQFALKP